MISDYGEVCLVIILGCRVFGVFIGIIIVYINEENVFYVESFKGLF